MSHTDTQLAISGSVQVVEDMFLQCHFEKLCSPMLGLGHKSDGWSIQLSIFSNNCSITGGVKSQYYFGEARDLNAFPCQESTARSQWGHMRSGSIWTWFTEFLWAKCWRTILKRIYDSSIDVLWLFYLLLLIFYIVLGGICFVKLALCSKEWMF